VLRDSLQPTWSRTAHKRRPYRSAQLTRPDADSSDTMNNATVMRLAGFPPGDLEPTAPAARAMSGAGLDSPRWTTKEPELTVPAPRHRPVAPRAGRVRERSSKDCVDDTSRTGARSSRMRDPIADFLIRRGTKVPDLSLKPRIATYRARYRHTDKHRSRLLCRISGSG
jgi:hypothetical protein